MGELRRRVVSRSRSLYRSYNEHDTSGDGALDVDEFNALIHILDPESSDEACEKLFTEAAEVIASEKQQGD